jgi:hypothetical protein
MPFAPGMGSASDLFPRIRCCKFVPELHRRACVEQRASPLENCRCKWDLPYPYIRCSGPVIAPPE